MSISSLDHVNIRTERLDETVAFYRDVIGLELGERPNFAFPGAWLYTGGEPVIHLIGGERGAGAGVGTGTIDHVAFGADDFDGFAAKLSGKSIEYEVRDVPGGKIRQVFLFDPNGVKIELNFRR